MENIVVKYSKNLSELFNTDEPVAILGSPGPQISVSCISLLSLCIPYIPIDSSYPLERIMYILHDSKVKNILIDSSVSDSTKRILSDNFFLVEIPRNFYNLDGFSYGYTIYTNESFKEQINISFAPSEVAYIIYTSGSTGTPKGIAVSRANLENQLSWLFENGHLGTEVKILQKTPIGFDAAQWEILAPLLGAKIVGVRAGEHRDPIALIHHIRKNSVTALQAVPTLLQALVDCSEFKFTPSLKHIYSGGEALPGRLVRDIFTIKPDVQITNLYGPSECTINASSLTLTSQDNIDRYIGKSIPLGAPVSNTYFSVRDVQPEGQQTLPKETKNGELWIEGAQVSIGYINKETETKQRFITDKKKRYYRTGDLVSIDDQGNYCFLGRVDNQVKIRGNRVELDEISRRYELHPWVAKAHCVLSSHSASSDKELVACIQLDPSNAPLMDGPKALQHHRSKTNKQQVRSQLSNPGIRPDLQNVTHQLEAINSKYELENRIYARKSYRFFQPHKPTHQDLTNFKRILDSSRIKNYNPQNLDFSGLAEVVTSALLSISGICNEERLLPKYGYASPGSLYSIRTYIELPQNLFPNSYLCYYNPLKNTLSNISNSRNFQHPIIHLFSKTSSISDVYKNNVKEVQYFELGHYLGAMNDALSQLGYKLKVVDDEKYITSKNIDNDDCIYLSSFAIVPNDGVCEFFQNEVSMMVSVLADGDIEKGTYLAESNSIQKISNEIIERNDVIAINQSVYDRATYAVGIFNNEEAEGYFQKYVSLGYSLHLLQAHISDFGFMSSGYSSFSENPLPSSVHAQKILDLDNNKGFSFYLSLAGPISESQRTHRGMDEDSVHMVGPAEIINQEMKRFVPEYMVPDRTVILSELPTTPNGKVNQNKLSTLPEVQSMYVPGQGRKPISETEHIVAQVWQEVLKISYVSAEDHFFKLGGDSIRVMMVLAKLNKEFNIKISPQTIFEHPLLEDLASAIEIGDSSSRFLKLNSNLKATNPANTVIWPGLGGAPFNLSNLGSKLTETYNVFGVQASGINEGEELVKNIWEMAEKDLDLLSLSSPVHLVGYSFGCRVAYAVAHKLSEIGQPPLSITLICPGNPTMNFLGIPVDNARTSSIDNLEFLAILLSIFDNSLTEKIFEEAKSQISNESNLIDFIWKRYPSFEREQIQRIINLASMTYEFDYTFDEISQSKISCPILLVKANGDKYSSVDMMLDKNKIKYDLYEMDCNHYQVLKHPYVDKLSEKINLFHSINNRLKVG